MKHYLVVLLIFVLGAVSVLAEDLTEEKLLGIWEIYWVEIHKADHYFPRVGGGDILEFGENNTMIRRDRDHPQMKSTYYFHVDSVARKISVNRTTGEFVFRWTYEQLTPDVLVASLWCPICEGKQESEDVTVMVRQK